MQFKKYMSILGQLTALSIPLMACSQGGSSSSTITQVNYPLVTIANPNNPNDPLTGIGSIDYIYKIGKYDVTISQYAVFLNAVAKTDKYFLYDERMATDLNSAGITRNGSEGNYSYTVMDNGGYSGNRPITYITWFNAARFANWMANGQPIGVEDSTPLGTKETSKITSPIVLCSILRAGLSLHHGFMSYFDEAENGFVSAYRHHYNNDDKFEILVEYQATPSFKDKNLILVDPMLATGQSIVVVLEKLLKEQQPKEIHIAVVIAAPEGIKYLQENLPSNCHLWVASLDDKLNEKNYIIPGLGDAGDLAYGEKL